jgi:hypothetical protein
MSFSCTLAGNSSSSSNSSLGTAASCYYMAELRYTGGAAAYKGYGGKLRGLLRGFLHSLRAAAAARANCQQLQSFSIMKHCGLLVSHSADTQQQQQAAASRASVTR